MQPEGSMKNILLAAKPSGRQRRPCRNVTSCTQLPWVLAYDADSRDPLQPCLTDICGAAGNPFKSWFQALLSSREAREDLGVSGNGRRRLRVGSSPLARIPEASVFFPSDAHLELQLRTWLSFLMADDEALFSRESHAHS